VNAKCTNVCSSLAANPEDTQVSLIIKLVKFALVDGSDTQLTLDSRNERRSLEKSTSQSFQGASELRLTTWEFIVQSNDANIFFSCTLLGFDESGSAIDADDETACNLRIKGTTVTSLLNSAN
jgi:hypothetical protein